MEFYSQYIYGANAPKNSTLIEDLPEIEYINVIKNINNTNVSYTIPILNYSFQEDFVYLIQFSVKAKTNYAQNIELYCIDIDDDNEFIFDNSIEYNGTFSIPSAPTEKLCNINYIFSPTLQDYNAITWDLENRNINNANNIIEISDVKIYILHNIDFFEGMDDDQLKTIKKIAIQGTPGSLVSINGGCFKIQENGIFEFNHDIEIDFVNVISLNESSDDFIIDLIYQTQDQKEDE